MTTLYAINSIVYTASHLVIIFFITRGVWNESKLLVYIRDKIFQKDNNDVIIRVKTAVLRKTETKYIYITYFGIFAAYYLSLIDFTNYFFGYSIEKIKAMILLIDWSILIYLFFFCTYFRNDVARVHHHLFNRDESM